MDSVLIIPARIGSKRIPEKNIKSFFGKPILAYSIEAAIDSGQFDRIIVSTDSEKIARISKQYGAEVPFLRSPKNSDDHATLVDVLIEVHENIKEKFEITCCLLSTAPFISQDKIRLAVQLMLEEDHDAVITVQKFTYPIERALYMDGNRVFMIRPENYLKRSQDFTPAYHDAGQLYLVKTKVLLSQKTLFPKNCGALVINELESQDIDNEIDWKLAEIKYKELTGL